MNKAYCAVFSIGVLPDRKDHFPWEICPPNGSITAVSRSLGDKEQDGVTYIGKDAWVQCPGQVLTGNTLDELKQTLHAHIDQLFLTAKRAESL